MRFSLLILFFVLFGLSGLRAENAVPVEAMDLTDILRHSYEHNPTMRAARYDLRATYEAIPQALTGYRPTITAEAGVLNADIEGSNFGGADGTTSRSYGVSASQPIFKSGRTSAEVSAARDLVRAREYWLEGIESGVMLEVVTAYMNVVRDRALLDLAKNNSDIIKQQLQAAQDRFDFGEITLTDVSQAKARFADSKSDVITAQGTLKNSEAVYRKLSGLNADTIYTVPDMPAALAVNRQEVISKALENNQTILESHYAHRSSEHDVDGRFRASLPTLTFNADWSKEHDPQPGLIDETRTRTYGLTLSVPLYGAGNARSRVREAKAQANQDYIEIIEARRDIESDAIAIWQNYETAIAEIKSREIQVEAAEVAREGVAQEMIFGTRTVLDSLDADQELLDARVALVSAQRDKVVAAYAMLDIMGELTAGNLGFGFLDSRAQMRAQNDNLAHQLFSFSIE